jgi:hypothetical protein
VLRDSQDPSPAGVPGRHCPACGADLAATARYCGRCGARQPDLPGLAVPPLAGGPPGRHSAARHSPARRTRWIVAGGAAGLAAVIAAIALVAVPLAHRYVVASSPVETVRAYFQALSDRDADRARALVNPMTFGVASKSVDEQNAQQMLTTQTLRDPGYTPPRLVQVSMASAQPRQYGGEAVLAEFDLADGRHQMWLPMYRSSGGVFGRWLINGGLASLRLPEANVHDLSLLVAGNPFPTTGLELPEVFPGSYRVALQQDPMLGAEPLTLASGSGVPVQMTVQLREDVVAAVQQQVHAYLATCAASDQARPQRCPIGYWGADPATDLQYKIIRYPILVFDLASAAGASVLGNGGRFQVTGHDTAQGGRAFTGEYEFTLQGTVTVDDGKPVFVPPS